MVIHAFQSAQIARRGQDATLSLPKKTVLGVNMKSGRAAFSNSPSPKEMMTIPDIHKMCLNGSRVENSLVGCCYLLSAIFLPHLNKIPFSCYFIILGGAAAYPRCLWAMAPWTSLFIARQHRKTNNHSHLRPLLHPL